MAKSRTARVPVHGKLVHNHAFLTAIGGLVINWANNESVFLAMMQCLVRGSAFTAAIVWEAQRTSRGRLELISRLARESIKDDVLLADITKMIRRFTGFSRTRNFFCHATYRYDDDLCLESASSYAASNEGEPLIFQTKRMGAATLNEITDASIKLAEFNSDLWKIVRRIEDALGVPQSKPLGRLPDSPMTEWSRLDLDMDEWHVAPPTSSQVSAQWGWQCSFLPESVAFARHLIPTNFCFVNVTIAQNLAGCGLGQSAAIRVTPHARPGQCTHPAAGARTTRA